MIDDALLDAEEKMEKAVNVAKEDMGSIRTGRANPAMFNRINIEYYGSMTPVTQVASINTPEPRLVVIKPYEASTLRDIETAIRNSDLGVNPTNDGTIIRVAIPQLTEERRREYIKLARHKAEDARVAVRNTRRHAIDAVSRLVKDKEIGEDDARGAEKQLDALTKKHVDLVDDLLKAKEAELMEV